MKKLNMLVVLVVLSLVVASFVSCVKPEDKMLEIDSVESVNVVNDEDMVVVLKDEVPDNLIIDLTDKVDSLGDSLFDYHFHGTFEEAVEEGLFGELDKDVFLALSNLAEVEEIKEDDAYVVSIKDKELEDEIISIVKKMVKVASDKNGSK